MTKSKAKVRGRVLVKKGLEILILGGTANRFSISGLKFTINGKRGRVLADRVRLDSPGNNLADNTIRKVSHELVSEGASDDEIRIAIDALQRFLKMDLKL